MTVRRMIVGISGASGFQYGVKALELLHPLDVEVHLVVSKGAETTRHLETGYSREQVLALADVVHAAGNLGASISNHRHAGGSMLHALVVGNCSLPE